MFVCSWEGVDPGRPLNFTPGVELHASVKAPEKSTVEVTVSGGGVWYVSFAVVFAVLGASSQCC
jgi:hypothetical protein